MTLAGLFLHYICPDRELGVCFPPTTHRFGFQAGRKKTKPIHFINPKLLPVPVYHVDIYLLTICISHSGLQIGLFSSPDTINNETSEELTAINVKFNYIA